MDDRSLRLLEFPRVVERLAQLCDTAVGVESALGLTPETDRERVEWRLIRTDEARRMLSLLPDVPLGGVRDLRPSIARAVRGGSLTASDLMDAEGTLSALRRTRDALLEQAAEWPALAEDAQLLPRLTSIENRLHDSVGPEGLLDAASPDLRRLRAETRGAEQEVRGRLEAVLRNPDLSRYLQEPLVTLRRGRFCLPVLREHQSRIPGVVHDASQTGQTLFIEPLFAIEIGNRVQELRRRAELEEERILRELSALLATAEQPLLLGLSAAAELDLSLAMGRLAEDMDAMRPVISESGEIHLHAARHPLIAEPVPISLEIGARSRVLVITGPNTGGKTVSLKTTGLLQVMAQCGLHVPAGEGTTLPVLREVLCDIGDEQSIEQSLSTFSSHLSAIVRILKDLTAPALVLLDEIGAGTDPVEGAALAQAIVERIGQSGAIGIVTTHYGELKAYAYQDPVAENASMTFDPQTLRPTYRLVQGAPGGSYAFFIAERLGLPAEVVARARGLLGEQRLRFEEMLQRVDQLRSDLERELESTRHEAKRARSEADRLEIQRREGELEREQLRGDLRRRLDQDFAELRRAIRQARDELRQERIVQRREEAVRRARQELDEAEEKVRGQKTPAVQEEAPQRPIEAGDPVFVPAVGQEGVALSGPDQEGRVWVAVGALRLQQPQQELRLRRRKPSTEKASSGWTAIAQQKAQSISPEVTVIGMRAEEALTTLDRYLDDAQVAGLSQVRIIHGKGTGALRHAVHEFLSEDRRVESHRLGGAGEGGVGATVVELRS